MSSRSRTSRSTTTWTSSDAPSAAVTGGCGPTSTATGAAQGFRSRQAVSMPTEPDDSPNYTLTYIVQPESVFNSPAASYQFLGRTASQAGGTWTIGPLDRVRLWEPGVRKFTANRI